MRHWVVLSAALLLTGCGEGQEPLICTGDLRPALRVAVVDSITMGAIAAPEVWIWVHTPQYRDSVRLTPAQAAGGNPFAHERAGVYTVDVSATGYAAWHRSNIPVTEDVCHVHTVEMEARMLRLPDAHAAMGE